MPAWSLKNNFIKRLTYFAQPYSTYVATNWNNLFLFCFRAHSRSLTGFHKRTNIIFFAHIEVRNWNVEDSWHSSETTGKPSKMSLAVIIHRYQFKYISDSWHISCDLLSFSDNISDKIMGYIFPLFLSSCDKPRTYPRTYPPFNIFQELSKFSVFPGYRHDQ